MIGYVMGRNMTRGEQVTFKDLYELLDKRTNEIYKVVDNLRRSFDELEAGRLTRLETRVAEMEGNAAGVKNNSTNIYTILSLIIAGLALASTFIR